MTKTVRLQKFIADCGYTSRRKAEDLIVQGFVELNGQRVTELGTKLNPDVDVLSVKGEIIDQKNIKKLYIIFHKPRGCVTTLNDPEGRETVMDYLQEFSERIYPVGRLDFLSEGLLIMTNDGETTQAIIHPSANIIKTYNVKVFGLVTPSIVKKLKAGVQTEIGFLKPLSVKIIKILKSKTWLEIKLSEGKNREIRRLAESLDITIDKLKRISIGNLSIDNLAPGKYKTLSKKQLLHSIGIDDKGILVSKQDFKSSVKSIKFKAAKGNREAPRKKAGDESFKQFRKETYYDTIKSIKEQKEKEMLEAKQPVVERKKTKPQNRSKLKK